MTAPERPAFSDEKPAILTDPAYSFLSFKEHRNLGGHAIIVTEYWGWVKLRSHSTAVKIAKSVEIFFSVSVFTIALGIQKKEATAGKETF